MAKVAAITSLLLACAATVALADPAPVKKVEAREAIAVTGRPNLQGAALTRLRTNIPANERVGTLEDGTFCGPKGTFSMNPKIWEVIRRTMPRAFRAEMTRAGYPNPLQSESAFEEKPRDQSEFEVGAIIRKLEVNLCIKGKESIGTAYAEIKWELFSRRSRTVVFDVTTEGSFEVPDAMLVRFDDWFERPFAVAARNMLAEQKFGDILAGSVPLPAAATADPAIPVRGTLSMQGGVAQNATLLRSSVVTIASGKGTGSGFFVSPDGHLITNQHVVGEARFVKITLATGRELVGEVVRVDRKRDLALIKTEPVAANALSIRVSEPNIGEDLYAIGSPLGNQFSGSVTRGVLSGHRTMNEQRYLQSDVAVLPGSSGGPLLDASGKVVGISVKGMLAGTASLNFFIPINDAVASLSLQVRD